MKRVTTGAYMMSAAHQSPNRKSPVPPKRARACAHNCRMRSISPRTSSLELLRAESSCGRSSAVRGGGWQSCECISAAIDRAMPRAASSSGQNRSRPSRSARNSMIARLSQTTTSPSHRIGTLPSDGRELVAFAALLPFVVEHRHDELLELLARLLAGEPAAHRPARISAVADDQLEQARLPQVVAASRMAVRNSATPLPVSLDVVKMVGWAAGCLAASARGCLEYLRQARTA